jgi:hypothetical protein
MPNRFYLLCNKRQIVLYNGVLEIRNYYNFAMLCVVLVKSKLNEIISVCIMMKFRRIITGKKSNKNYNF